MGAGERSLGGSEVALGVTGHLKGGVGKLLVLLGLGRNVGPHGAEEGAGLSGKTVLGVLTVAFGLGLDLVNGTVESIGHLLHGILGVLTVLLHELVELSIVLDVLLVAVLTGLDHAVELGLDLVVHISLRKLVRLHSLRELVLALDELRSLLGSSRLELKNVGLEVGLELLDAVVGLLLGLSDVRDSLCEAFVLEKLASMQGSVHTRRRSREGGIGVGAVLGHGGAHIGELLGSGGGGGANLVGSPLAEFLVLRGSIRCELGPALLRELLGVVDLVVEVGHGLIEVGARLLGVGLHLRGVGSNVLVGATDLGIGGLIQGSESALLGSSRIGESPAGLTLVGTHDGTGLAETLDIGTVARVLDGGHVSELPHGAAHGSVEVVLGNLGVLRHLLHEGRLHLLASGCVELHVLLHLGADRGDVSLARLHLLGDVASTLLKKSSRRSRPSWPFLR